MTGSVHCQITADLVTRYGASVSGFRRAVGAHAAIYGYGPGDEDEITGPRVVPDAWRMDVTSEDGPPYAVITAWEVEVTHPLPARKLRDYMQLWYELDAADEIAELRLRTVDRYGTERSVDLMAGWYAGLVRT